MTPKRVPANPAPDAEAIDFETALARLDTVVRDLESGHLPLEEALKRFEEGTRLARFCRDRLLAVEAKVSELLADGTVQEIAVEQK